MKTTDKFTFFWNSDECFSNWYMSTFVHDGISFNCGEQYMMYQKAKLFNDTEIMKQVLLENTPRGQKILGRQVKNFNKEIWESQCLQIMEEGLQSKFEQNPDILKQLLDTGNTELVEASPMDTIWGIGMSQDNPLALDKSTWKGKNFLGIVLTNVRERIKSNQ